jgi:hypothetical protein
VYRPVDWEFAFYAGLGAWFVLLPVWLPLLQLWRWRRVVERRFWFLLFNLLMLFAAQGVMVVVAGLTGPEYLGYFLETSGLLRFDGHGCTPHTLCVLADFLVNWHLGIAAGVYLTVAGMWTLLLARYRPAWLGFAMPE